MPFSRGTEKPAKEAPPPDLTELFSRSFEWVDKPLWIALVGAVPTKSPEDVLDDALSKLWLDLYDYEEKHPSSRARLAAQLVKAAKQLLRDEKDEKVRAMPALLDGRTKLAYGVSVYLKARGNPAPDVRIEWSVGYTIRRIRIAIVKIRSLIEDKNPGTSFKDSPAICAAFVSWAVSEVLWNHEDLYSFRKYLIQNGQPVDAPNTERLTHEVERIFIGRYNQSPTPPAPDTWPDLAARVLAAAVRVAGGDRRFADNLLRSERGTPKGEKSGSVNSPRKQSGSVNRALLPPRRKKKG